VASLASERLNVTVVATPQVIQKGQMIELSIAITGTTGLSVVVPRVYMEIVDSRGRVVWPMSVLAKDTSGFTRLISTAELKPNTRYTIRAAINNKLIRMGFAVFKTAKGIFPALLLPGLSALALIPKSAEAHKSDYLMWETEHDARVCPICLNLSGRTWKASDPDIPRVGPPEFGGASHWGCRCNLLVVGVLNAALQQVRRMHAAVAAVAAVQKYKKQMELQIT